jgi:hypothetical protein
MTQTTTRLKGVLHGADGELYVILDGRRLLLAKCDPKIKVYEKTTQVNVLGVIGHVEKQVYFTIILCPSPEVFQKVNNDFIRRVEKVELVFDAYSRTGIVESIKIDNLTTGDLDYEGDWEFEAILSPLLTAKLLGYLE